MGGTTKKHLKGDADDNKIKQPYYAQKWSFVAGVRGKKERESLGEEVGERHCLYLGNPKSFRTVCGQGENATTCKKKNKRSDCTVKKG